MYERITAGDVQPGDRIARAKTHRFRLVTRIEEGPVSVRFTYDSGGADRPRKAAAWWRLTGGEEAQR